MATFSMTPITDLPAPTADGFPDYMQLQAAGTDLGLPTADTINFSTGLTATRGTGENENIVTVTAEGGGGGSAAGLLRLLAVIDFGTDEFVFDGGNFSNFTTVETPVSSADWEWDADQNLLHFIENGIYQIVATCTINARSEWPDGPSTFGSSFAERSTHPRTHASGDPDDTSQEMRWTDQHILMMGDDSYSVAALWADALGDPTVEVQFASMEIVITRLAPYLPG